jgi:hypothetical protein
MFTCSAFTTPNSFDKYICCTSQRLTAAHSKARILSRRKSPIRPESFGHGFLCSVHLGTLTLTCLRRKRGL